MVARVCGTSRFGVVIKSSIGQRPLSESKSRCPDRNRSHSLTESPKKGWNGWRVWKPSQTVIEARALLRRGRRRACFSMLGVSEIERRNKHRRQEATYNRSINPGACICHGVSPHLDRHQSWHRGLRMEDVVSEMWSNGVALIWMPMWVLVIVTCHLLKPDVEGDSLRGIRRIIFLMWRSMLSI